MSVCLSDLSCVSSQPSPACLVLWNTCRRITSTGRAWTRWSARVCVLHLRPDRLPGSSPHPSPQAGYRTAIAAPAVEQLEISAPSRVINPPPTPRKKQPGQYGTSLTAGDWAADSILNHSLFSHRSRVENRLLFEGCVDSLLPLYGWIFPHSTCVDLMVRLTIGTIQHNTQ